MSRIEHCFTQLRRAGRTALIPYVTAGDPSVETTEALVHALEESGADVIELGIPFSDPLADGPVIQRAATRSLDNGVRLKDIFAMVERIRTDSDVPLVFLVYYNSVYRHGAEPFLRRCAALGVDGLVIPDLPLEERAQVQEVIADLGLDIDLIPLVAPTSKERTAQLVEGASGFIYCVSSLGVTGMRERLSASVKDLVEKVHRHTAVPAAVGFGVSTTEHARTLKPFADGLIVGSAIVRQIEAGLEAGDSVQRVQRFAAGLRQALDEEPGRTPGVR